MIFSMRIKAELAGRVRSEKYKDNLKPVRKREEIAGSKECTMCNRLSYKWKTSRPLFYKHKNGHNKTTANHRKNPIKELVSSPVREQANYSNFPSR